MEKILIFKTSTDATIKKLLNELGKKDIDCLIQSSQIAKYQEEYPYINCIDIHQERFENLPVEVTNEISKKRYDYFYLTLTREDGYNFWNVIRLACRVRFKKAFFYNCNGKKIKIPKKSVIGDMLYRMYVRWVELIY